MSNPTVIFMDNGYQLSFFNTDGSWSVSGSGKSQIEFALIDQSGNFVDARRWASEFVGEDYADQVFTTANGSSLLAKVLDAAKKYCEQKSEIQFVEIDGVTHIVDLDKHGSVQAYKKRFEDDDEIDRLGE